MTDQKPNPTSPRSESNPQETERRWLLPLLAGISLAAYCMIAFLSTQFTVDNPPSDRPIVLVMSLFGFLFAIYVIAVLVATKVKQNSGLVLLIVVAAVVFRIPMLFSAPIQEVDIYRYMWDGIVSAQGISPFRYPPQTVMLANSQDFRDRELRELASLRDRHPPIAEVLRRVHYGELPTIYPATSQAVFYCAAVATPVDASLTTRLLIMKASLIAFDLATLFLVIKLLSLAQMPIGLSILYGWCPLVMKEVANSGHLDAIAVFLCILSVYLIARLFFSEQSPLQNRVKFHANLILVALVLAAAVGAKLYPVVLTPLILFGTARRFGWKAVGAPIVAFSLATFFLLNPMLPPQLRLDKRTAVATTESGEATSSNSGLPAASDPSRGVTAFFKSWEMNDFVFMVLVENLKPTANNHSNQPVWFSVFPEELRQPIATAVARRFSIPAAEAPFSAPFLLTRIVTTLAFLCIALLLAWKTSKRQGIALFCEAAFLTLAWFWLLLPTQNPWYWLWALPLLPFARNRAWIAISGLVLVYYLRFWFDYCFADIDVLGTGYRGTAFFDFVVTWIEFAPWFLWLTIEYWRRGDSAKTDCDT